MNSIAHPHTVRSPLRWIAILTIFAAVFVGIWFRFREWMPRVFYGDDLKLLLYFMDQTCATKPHEILTAVCQERFRPVASGPIIAIMALFGANMLYFQLFNVLVQALTAAIVFILCMRLSKSLLISLSIVATVAFSRFATFQVTHAIGPVESLPLFFCLLAIYSVLRASDGERHRLLWNLAALLFTFVAINGHERYLVLAPWLAMAFVISTYLKEMSVRRCSLLLVMSFFLPFAYVVYKTYILSAHFLIGTAETHLEIDYPLIAKHVQQAFLSVFGFNNGPEYLIGKNVDFRWMPALLTASCFSLSWLLLCLAGVATVFRSKPRVSRAVLLSTRWPIFLLCLAVLLTIPTLLTVRLELRWYFATFVCLMLVAAWAAGRLLTRNKIASYGLVATLAVSSLILDALLMRTFGQMSIFWLPRQAELIKRDISDRFPQRTGDVVLFTREEGLCDWGLWRGDFFRVYGTAHRSVTCYPSIDSAVAAGLPENAHAYALNEGVGLRDITEEVRTAIDERRNSYYDFLESFPTGSISDPRKVDTPTGAGVLIIPWDSATGRRNSLTVLSGFSYRYDNIEVPTNAQLTFASGLVFAAPQVARLSVQAEITSDGITENLARIELAPPAPGSELSFLPHRLDLKKYAGQRIAIVFSVDSPGGDASGHWVGLVEPRIVVAPSN